jgi:hypothetical protein
MKPFLYKSGLESRAEKMIFRLTAFIQLLDYRARSGKNVIIGDGFCSCGLLTGMIHREIIKLKKELILNL